MIMIIIRYLFTQSATLKSIVQDRRMREYIVFNISREIAFFSHILIDR